ncbi:MAG: glycosyltransferase [Deltaproteobacteria bacterium]|nr:glycosyltransferase [Deltaproteobacteria bacterium]
MYLMRSDMWNKANSGIGVAVSLILCLLKLPLLLLKEKQKGRHGGGVCMAKAYDIVCISHVVWNNSWQRNHHTMNRMASRHRVIYCNPHPVSMAVARQMASLKEACHPSAHSRNLTVITPVVLRGERIFPFIKKINKLILWSAIREKIEALNLKNIVLWFYSPLYEYMAGAFDERLTVYDIQDEYSEFLGNPETIKEKEKRLLSKADLVFTGTYALYEARKPHHPNIHFIPCGVDIEHFQRAARGDLPIPGDIMHVPHPIIGYFGMVCGRMDTALLEYMASRHPEWSVVLIGEIAERDFSISDRPNIYLLGRKSYANLPCYLQTFDACMIPFRLNELTLKVNPTKLLEYLAAGKPVISTAIPDMIRFYGDVIHIAEDKEQFVRLTEKAVAEAGAGKSEICLARMRTAEKNDWAAAIKRMEDLITSAIQARHGDK